jgi:hypothetical protein
MRVATVVLLACIGSAVLRTAAPADELADDARGDAAQGAADSPQVERMQAMGICEQTVAERLENSSAARWADRGQYKVTRQGPGQFAIDGFVDVQGALGDVRTPWTCRAIRGFGDQWQAAATLGQSTPTSDASASQPPAPDRVPPRAPDAPAVARPESEPPAPPRSAASPPERWSEVGSCRRLRIVDAYADKYPERRMQIVKGVVEYSGSQPIRNVRVCASGTCKTIRGAYPPLQGGAREPFTLEVPTLEIVTVTAECSTLTAEP